MKGVVLISSDKGFGSLSHMSNDVRAHAMNEIISVNSGKVSDYTSEYEDDRSAWHSATSIA